MISERAFQEQVVAYARLNGWAVYHPYDSRRSEAGFPDLTMTRDGRLIFAELKSERGRVSLEQEDWLGRLVLTPAEVRVWRPADWPAIEATLRRERT